jgi:organic hydroperoxide reductase OsmC/OhrA
MSRKDSRNANLTLEFARLQKAICGKGCDVESAPDFVRSRREDGMNRDDDIRSAQERALSIFERKPSAALSCAKTRGRLDEGLQCTVSSGQLDVRMDMPREFGGDGSAPSPGFFVRAGLIGCVAIGIKMTAAREGVQLDSVDVDVEMDFDDGAMLGLGDNTAAPLETRLTITLESPAPWVAVEEMARRALATDPYYLAFRDAQRMNFTLVAKQA